MSFKQKTWNDRISEYPTRRTLTDVSDNTTKTVDVAREEGTISQEGDAFSAANMNDLEGRIADGFSTLSQDSLKMSSSNPSSDSIKFGINASGQYGYIKQGASEVTPFRNPTGNASPSDVLSGKTFSTASLENARGTMANNGTNKNAVSVGGGSGSLYAYMPYGYYDNYNNSGNAWINITNDQAKTLANNAGVGYNSGYAKGNSVKPSNFIIGVAVTVKQQGFSGIQYTWGSGCRGNGMNVTIDPGYYYHVAVFNGNGNSKSWVTDTNGYASSTLTFAITDGNELTSMAVAMTSNYPIF